MAVAIGGVVEGPSRIMALIWSIVGLFRVATTGLRRASHAHTLFCSHSAGLGRRSHDL
jgi:hypothetical protein